MQKYDVAIVGLGAMGSSALFHAARQGLRVVGLEQFGEVPHHNGSHHGSTRIIRKAYFEHPGYVPLLLRAYELWEELEQLAGEPILVKCGGLMIGSPKSEVVTGALLAARTHGLAYEELSHRDLARRYPQFQLDANQVAVYEPDAGFVFSETAVRAHAELAVAAGAHLRLNARVTGWQVTPDGGVEVYLGGAGDGAVGEAGEVAGAGDAARSRAGSGAGEVIRADKLILTVGAWAPEFMPKLPLRVERQILYWFGGNSASEASDVAAGSAAKTPLTAPRMAPGDMANSPIYIAEEDDGIQYYGFPTLATEGTKIAFHHAGEVCTPDTIDRDVSAEEVQRMRELLARRIPSLAGQRLLKTSTCMYTNTPDFHFVVGAHPRHSQVILGLGYSGHGFKFASVMGEILADLARGHHPLPLPDIFSPARVFE